MDCARYEVGCGKCPQLKSCREHDLSRLVVAGKRALFPSDMRVVGISPWLSDCATRSQVFAGHQVTTIPNCIDVGEFFPVDKGMARQALGLPQNGKVILFGSQGLDDFYKGLDLFADAIGADMLKDAMLVSFGHGGNRFSSVSEVPAVSLGFLRDAVSLRLAYSAADVFVAPSRMDAFAKTIVEAMACAVPVVCFDATGPGGIVEHEVTGYKATPFDPRSLRQGIEWVLSLDDDAHKRIGHAARQRALETYDAPVVARRYRDLYEEMLRP